MVTFRRTSDQKSQIIIRANASLSWRGNLWMLGSFLLVTLLISALFIQLGTWMILPFAGLEMLLLYGCLYWVSWKQQNRQIIELDSQFIRIIQGHYRPERQWRWRREDTTLKLIPAAQQDNPDQLWLTQTSSGQEIQSNENEVRLGSWLNGKESQRLCRLLQAQGIPLMQPGPAGQRPF